MQNINMFSFSCYQIERFIAVADFLSFTKAARKLNLSQSVVSKSVAALEASLSITLFCRENGSISLTPAGIYLYNFWKRDMPLLEQSIIKAYNIQQGFTAQLSVALYNSYDISRFFVPIIRRFREKYPKIKLYTACYSFPGLRSRVLKGSLDCAFTSRFEGDYMHQYEPDLGVRELTQFPLTTVMLKSNPLAKKRSIRMEDLKDQCFVILSPTRVPANHKLIERVCLDAGFTPREYEFVEDGTAFPLSLNDSDQVYISDCAAKAEPSLPLKTFRLAGMDSGLSLIWHNTNTNSALQLFMQECDIFFKEHPHLYVR